MRTALRFAIAAIALACLVGCSKPSVVGKWATTGSFFGIPVDMTMEFKPDGSLTGSGSKAIQGSTGTVTVNGRWSVAESGSEQTLTMNQSDIVVSLAGQTQKIAGPTISGKLTFAKDKFTLAISQGTTTVLQDFTKVH